MTVLLQVKQLECTSCANNIENFLQKQRGIEGWDINIMEQTVEIDYDDGIYPTPEDVARLVKKSGFDAEVVEE